MANTTIPVLTPRSKTISSDSPANLDIAVKAQVNTLVQAFLAPKNTGQPVGTVENGSISISPSDLVYNTNGSATWATTVFWNEFLLPS